MKSSQYLEETIEDDRGGKDNEVIVIGEKVTKLTRKVRNELSVFSYVNLDR